MHICKERLGCSGENMTSYSRDGDLEFERCNDCGIIWRSQESAGITKDYGQTYFDSKKYGKNRTHKIKKSGWLIDMARHYNPQIDSLLEVGCSIGNTLEAGRSRSISHLGIDISKYAVEYCREQGLNAEQLDLIQLNQRNEKYDLIFMQHVLEHFTDPFNALDNCHNLLDQNGTILILVPNSKYRRAVKYNSAHRFYSTEGVGSEHFAYFDYSNLTAALRACGFEIIQENYPLSVLKRDSFAFYMNRLFRRLLSQFNSDQEILVLAKKRD